jgi:hypothetical protein
LLSLIWIIRVINQQFKANYMVITVNLYGSLV